MMVSRRLGMYGEVGLCGGGCKGGLLDHGYCSMCLYRPCV